MKFFADVMAGKLARWLRLCGIDCAYEKSIADEELARLAGLENRIILTRDTHIGERFKNIEVLLLDSQEISQQLCQVAQTYSLDLQSRLFSRCLEDNTLVVEVDRDSVVNKVPPYVFHTQSRFWRCPSCQRIFWAGSHHQNMLARLKRWQKQWQDQADS